MRRSCLSLTHVLGAALFRGVGAASRLRKVDLHSNRLGDAAAEALANVLDAQSAIAGGGALRVVHLGSNQIGCAGAEALARARGAASCALIELVLQGNPGDDYYAG